MFSRGLFVVACLGLSVPAAIAAEPEAAKRDLPRLKPTEPAEALGTFTLKPGFRIELAAAEPLVADPVAMAFDEHGRLFVVEMIGYSEHREDRLGQVRLLEDTDGDGVPDNKEHLFSLEVPRTCTPQLSEAEHSDSCWLSFDNAIERVWSWSNRNALERVAAAGN